MMKNLLLGILFSFLFFACKQIASEETVIRNTINDIIAADNRSDLEAVLSYYSSNATLMPPGKLSFSGKDRIRINYQGIFATTRLQLESNVEGVVINRFNAIAWGHNTGKAFSLKDSNVRVINDKYLMHLIKENGKWKIQRLIWNSD
jgi:ketosteroid isomerase-like protein